ncbi:ammonium transporter [uncultured Gardnerella sp.]|uniref:ammonium transporter n=1 Tax=uncultured Gardnerella sp. TaxID=293424 RepID=UPI0025FB3878|nr:ammonium transporter [uncultured Gardnerella sp.]
MTAIDPQLALLAAALVFIITPGIALFYGGREKATSMINMMMLSAGAVAVTTIVWTLWGWSLAFAGKDMLGGIFGDPMSGLLFRDSMVSDSGIFTSMDVGSGIANELPAAFRLACAIVAVSLITGALAGRVRYAIWLIFVAVWITLVFSPLMHMVYGGGLLSAKGAISQALGVSIHDFAGGSTLNLAAAVSALAIVFIIGGHAKFPLKRFILHAKGVFSVSSHASSAAKSEANSKNHSKGKLEQALWNDVARSNGNHAAHDSFTKDISEGSLSDANSMSEESLVGARQPHNVPFIMLGIFIIWFGWLGLMIGSSMGVPGAAVYSWISSTITASASMLAWGVTERLRFGRFTALGSASGVMAGLAASSASANVIAPLWALLLGVFVGVVTSLVSYSHVFARYDGALHVVSVNGVAAIIGLLAVGLFADGKGLLVVGDWHQLVAQICLICIVILYAGVITAVLAFALEKLFGWRISEAKERKGVDLADQGERAYDFSSIVQARSGAVVEVSDATQGKTQMAVLTPVSLDVDDVSSESSSTELEQSKVDSVLDSDISELNIDANKANEDAIESGELESSELESDFANKLDEDPSVDSSVDSSVNSVDSVNLDSLDDSSDKHDEVSEDVDSSVSNSDANSSDSSNNSDNSGSGAGSESSPRSRRRKRK